jgi:predicted RNA-binding Zn-ribbon protein involved in translation (DUF1610 family)
MAAAKMTITLQCGHCNQTMAIAPRKPGSLVSCPACGQGVVVPGAEGAKPAAVAAVAVVAPAPRAKEPVVARLPTRPAAAQVWPQETAWSPRVEPSTVAGAPVVNPTVDPPRGLAVPLSVAILGLVFGLVSLGMAFVAGYLLGKHG